MLHETTFPPHQKKPNQVADKQRNAQLKLSVDKREGGHIGFITPGSS